MWAQSHRLWAVCEEVCNPFPQVVIDAQIKEFGDQLVRNVFMPGENTKATKASYKVSLLIAKAGKPHSIGETLVKPAAKVMANIMLGEKASEELNKVHLPMIQSRGE